MFLADVGVARNIFGGVAAFSVQNLGRRSIFGDAMTRTMTTSDDDDDEDDDGPPTIPRQMLMGWSTTRPAGRSTSGCTRSSWSATAGRRRRAGIEVGYSWIEGCSVALRAGARRPESGAERPYAFGAALTVDRLTVEYSRPVLRRAAATPTG